MILDFLIGCAIGGTLVGSSVQRTLSVGKGEVGMTALNAGLNSLSYFFSVSFIAKDNLVAYLGTCLGSTLVVLYMAIRNKKRKNVH